MEIKNLRWPKPPEVFVQYESVQGEGRCLRNLHVYCVHAFFAALGAVVDDISFADVVDQTCYVHENFLFRGVINDKTKSFGFVEKLYCSSIHCKKEKNVMWQLAATKVRRFL